MFSDIAYYLLLAVAVLVYRFVGPVGRRAVLAGSGILFYTYYARSAVFLLLGLTVISWVALFVLTRDPEEGKPGLLPKRAVCLAAIAIFVGILGYYKYAAFFESMIGIEGAKGPAVPLAISFFIFEFVHVSYERLRNNLPKVPFLDYLAFIFFFPTMIAGPIKRYNQFDPCLEGKHADANDILEGIFRIALGLFKKIVLADNLNTIISEIGNPEKTQNTTLLTLAVVLYGFRILLDFAGYSDIAIGSARLFGIRVPENFLYPYRQPNIALFWRNWHVSLYMWFTDYVFIPLGGSRGKLGRTLFNVMAVMLLSGLWHGAAWNFVIWGGWHGLLLVIHRLWNEFGKPRLPASFTEGKMAWTISYSLTMLAVWFGWLLFMWPLDQVGRYLSQWTR